MSTISKEFLNLIFEQTSLPMAVIKSPDFIFEMSNSSHQACHNYENILGKKVSEIMGEDSLYFKLIKKVHETGERIGSKAYTFESGLFDLLFEPIKNHSGGIEAVLVTGTISHETEKRILESEHRFRTVFSLAAVGIAMATVKGQILQVNPAYSLITGYSEEELLRLTFADITHPEEREDNYKVIKKLLDDGDTGKIHEKRYIKKTGEIVWAQVTISIVRDVLGNAENVITIIEDITERRLSRQKIEKLAFDLQSAVKARDEFLSIASHELKTPLTSLKLQTQMTKRLTHASEINSELVAAKNKRFVLQVEKQIERLMFLVDDMLDISRITTGKLTFKKETFDFCEVVEEVIDRLSPLLIDANCPVTLAIPKPVIGEWDRDRLEQVLTNLLTNSSRYGAGKPIIISVHEEQDQAEIRVRDYGRGIAKIDHERIFNRYERAISFNEVSGLGLGLFIVKEMLEKNKGSIKVESELGLGATFIVNLPIQRE